MNLILLLITMSFLVPENGAGTTLSKEISQVSNEASVQFLVSSSQDQANDKDELDDGAYFLTALWASTNVPNVRLSAYTLLRAVSYIAHPIRAPPHHS